uniref:Uncharacterized protein n=1 Tax=Anguilla anguilla TaxID=7936 RepID=A0A0E9V4M5_ANGAN
MCSVYYMDLPPPSGTIGHCQSTHNNESPLPFIGALSGLLGVQAAKLVEPYCIY